MSYIYLKKSAPKRFKLDKLKKKSVAIGLFSLGMLAFFSAIFPIVKYQVEYSLKFQQIINPLSTKNYNNTGNILGEMTTDYTQISNWFIDSPAAQARGSVFSNNNPDTTYLISIPSLKIKDAVVDVGSMDLKKSLIQYPKTALPGQLGNTVIFGHSVLPQFFNPKSYLTIFSTLHKLKIGDEIQISFNGSDYVYKVQEMFEVQPTEMSVLDQRFDGKYLSLITCSPPGTLLRRLVIKASL
ncbi:MAG: sortase [Candidatus Shapirobacteria bacterium]